MRDRLLLLLLLLLVVVVVLLLLLLHCMLCLEPLMPWQAPRGNHGAAPCGCSCFWVQTVGSRQVR